MRHSRANNLGDRSNALWGRGSRGEQRSNALWGRGGRRAGVAVASLTVLFAMAAGASAAGTDSTPVAARAAAVSRHTFRPNCVARSLRTLHQTFDVIVQGDKNGTANGFYKKLAGDNYWSACGSSSTRSQGLRRPHRQPDPESREEAVRDLDHGERDREDGWRSAPELESQLWPWATGARSTG